MEKNSPKESIAVVGGGISGIAAALELAKSGRVAVTIFEKEDRLGGLSSFYQWQNVICDRFYHVILPTDGHLVEFLKELGLEAGIHWEKTKSGFYGQNTLASFSSSLDFIRFPFLSWGQKLRLAVGILFATMIKDPQKMDRLPARDWLIRVFGGRVYAHFWDPLLRSKFGAARNRVSSTLIWATIKRLYGARSSSRKQEKMGQVRGGYHAILEEGEKALAVRKVKTRTAAEVKRARLAGNLPGEIATQSRVVLSTEAGDFGFDRVLFTLPSPLMLKVLGNPDDRDDWRRLRETEYLRVICVLLILRRKLSPYYVINLLDQELPFTGIIETTNIVSPAEVDQKHLVYLPCYLTQDDPLSSLSDTQIAPLFLGGLRKVFPGLKDEDILHSRVFREEYVQPVMKPGALEVQPTCRTPSPGIYVANTALIRDSTLNNNAAIQVALRAAAAVLADMGKD